MKLPTLLYVFPSSLDHYGLQKKVFGQKKTLEKWYDVKLIYPRFHQTDSKLVKAIMTLTFLLKASLASLWSSVIYVRYNPKLPMLFIAFCLLSRFKPIYIEYNALYDKELAFLGRRFERAVHLVLMWFLARSACFHVVVSDEKRRYLIKRHGFASVRTVYVQNGFYPETRPTPREVNSKVLTFKREGTRLAIFVGNGYAWNGLSEIEIFLKSYPNVQLIVVGPYEKPSTDQICYLGRKTQEELSALYPLCDFAIGSFRLDLMGLTQASSLKTYEYLSYGLPNLLAFHESAAEIPELSAYFFNLESDPDALTRLLASSFSKEEICKAAETFVSWEANWRRVKILIPEKRCR